MSACSRCSRAMCSSASSRLLLPSHREASSSSICKAEHVCVGVCFNARPGGRARLAHYGPLMIPAGAAWPCQCIPRGPLPLAQAHPGASLAHRALAQSQHGSKGMQEGPAGEKCAALLLAQLRRQRRLQRCRDDGWRELRAARQRGAAGRRLAVLVERHIEGQAAGGGRGGGPVPRFVFEGGRPGLRRGVQLHAPAKPVWFGLAWFKRRQGHDEIGCKAYAERTTSQNPPHQREEPPIAMRRVLHQARQLPRLTLGTPERPHQFWAR